MCDGSTTNDSPGRSSVSVWRNVASAMRGVPWPTKRPARCLAGIVPSGTACRVGSILPHPSRMALQVPMAFVICMSGSCEEAAGTSSHSTTEFKPAT